MKKLLIALLLTFVLAFTYSCSDMAGNPSSGGPDDKPDITPPTPEPEVPEPEPEPDPDDEIIETGKEWKNIKFLDNVSVPAPADVTIVDKFIISAMPNTDIVTQTEAIIDSFTYDQFKTYITDLKASELYTGKTHSNIVHILTEESLLPATLEDTATTNFVFDNDTHYAIVTFYGNNYVDATRSTARPNLSIKLTRKDPFSKIGGKLKVMRDVQWADLKFETGAELPAPVGTVALVIYDNATDKQEMYIDIKSMSVANYKAYLKVIQRDAKFIRHRAIPDSAATGIEGVPPFADGATASKTATWVITDKLDRYISVAYIGENSPTYTNTNFKITINNKDPFAKGSEVKESGLSIAEAIAKITPITEFPAPAFVAGQGEVVTFTDTKYGQEIRFEVEDSKYGAFRNYLRTKKNVGLIYNPYKNKTHQKVPLPTGWLYETSLGVAFKEAAPVTHTDTVTGAWSFEDGVDDKGVKQYISFIWHGKNSPNNPNKNGKDIFIIERMSSDPMWFLP